MGATPPQTRLKQRKGDTMANLNSLPRWSTLARRNALVDLFCRSGGFCVFGHSNCLIPEHHYEGFTTDLIKDWIAYDREADRIELEAELKQMHSLGERFYPLRGQFSAIAKDIFAGNQPLFYLETLGISGVTLTPFAKVRISSSYMRLYVDLGDTLREVSKNKRRKAVRYGKRLPHKIEADIALQVRQAVDYYFNH